MARRRSRQRGGALTDMSTLLPLLGLGYIASQAMSKRQYGPRQESDIFPLSGGKRKSRRRSRKKRSSRRRSRH